MFQKKMSFLERTTQEMDVMLKKQVRLLGKLREECKRQAGQIEKLTKRNRLVHNVAEAWFANDLSD